MKKKHLSRKALILAAVTAFMVGSLAGCKSTSSANADNTNTSEAAASDNTDQNYKVVRIGCGDTKNNQLNDLAAVAQEEGYFEKELNAVGYTLEVTGFQGQGPEISSAIMSGSLDGGNIAEFPAYSSKSSGSDVSVIGITNPKFLYGLLAIDDNIKNVKDLEGKKVVVQQGTAMQYVWEQIVALTGIDDSKIEVINASVLDGISLLQTGDADAIISAKYSLDYYAKSGLGHLVEGVPDDASSTTLIVLNNDYIAENPDVPVAINKALIEAYNTVEQNPQILYDTIGKKMGDAGAAVIEEGYKVNDSISYLTPEFSEELLKKVNEIYKWQEKNNLLSGKVDVDSFFDSSYYEKALEELK
ncbi:ABC transporter substrate-binding protein [Lachnospiraceae bacterium SGI.085]